MWSADDIRFTLLDDLSVGPVATVEIGTPNGILLVMGEPRAEARSLIVSGVHMHGTGIGPNGVGPRNLRVIVDALLREMDYDDVVLEGAVRTSGANPNRRPRPIRFTRRGGAAPHTGPGEP